MLRLSAEHDLRILIPMIILPSEIEWVRDSLEKVAADFGVDRLSPAGRDDRDASSSAVCFIDRLLQLTPAVPDIVDGSRRGSRLAELTLGVGAPETM
jgi:hypothetical protein